MREIKFRVWDIENKEMLDIEYLYWDDCTREFLIRTTMYTDYFTPEEMILMQYTGLHDKNGKEVYEGDILREYGNEIDDWIVSYEDGKFIGTCDNICEDLYEISDLEIIGNIYENPELLERSSNGD